MQTTMPKSAYFAATLFIIVVALFCLFICSRALRREQATGAGSAYRSADPAPPYGGHHSTATAEDGPVGVSSIGSPAYCGDTLCPAICDTDQYEPILLASNGLLASQTHRFCS
ncbi:MAG: hypothetical protein SWQ30_22265 [Thermodesulfobacteriota bacterium]|nr:hypothetical protein [Thermodesulfobacteriota bacterium]